MDRELTINQVAYKFGFQYSQHFTRQFKKHFGVTPSEYIRGNYREAAASPAK